MTTIEKRILSFLLLMLLFGQGLKLYLKSSKSHEFTITEESIGKPEKKNLIEKPKRSIPKPQRFPINVNQSSATELARLPHVGPKMAREIVEYRLHHGPFKNKTDLLLVPHMGVSLLKKIETYLLIE